MGKLKVTLVRKPTQLTKPKATGYSIIMGKNLKKIKNNNSKKK